MDAIVSILEALADQGKASSAPVRPKAPPPPARTPPPAPKPPAPATAPEPVVAPPAREKHGLALQGMFADGNSLLRAIIAAEVVGPPVSLKEHHLWNRQPNEPST